MANDGEEEGDEDTDEEEDPADTTPSASELAGKFAKFLRSPEGLAALPPAELRALAAGAAVAAAGASVAVGGGAGGAAVGLRAAQDEVEIRHAAALASSPEAAAVWEDAKRLLADAALRADLASAPGPRHLGSISAPNSPLGRNMGRASPALGAAARGSGPHPEITPAEDDDGSSTPTPPGLSARSAVEQGDEVSGE